MASHTSKCWLPRYTTSVHYTPSLPIPVPIPSARHAIPAHYPRHQVVTVQPMTVHTHAAVPFAAHAVALQSQFRSATPRYPGTIVQHEEDGAATMRHKSGMLFGNNTVI